MGWRHHGARVVSRSLAIAPGSSRWGSNRVIPYNNALLGSVTSIDSPCGELQTSSLAAIPDAASFRRKDKILQNGGCPVPLSHQRSGNPGKWQQLPVKELYQTVAGWSENQLPSVGSNSSTPGCNHQFGISLKHQNWRSERWEAKLLAFGSQRLSVSTRAPSSKESQTSKSGTRGIRDLKDSRKAAMTGNGKGASGKDNTVERNATVSTVEASTEAATEDSSQKGPAVEIVVREDKSNLGSYMQDLWSALKMRIYVTFHKIHLEKSFNEAIFLEQAKLAFRVVNHLVAIGDFEQMESMVAPTMLEVFKKFYTDVLMRGLEKGIRVEFFVTKVEDARLVDFEIAFEKEGDGGYGLQKMVPDLEGYHDDMFLVLAVRLHVESSQRFHNEAGETLKRHIFKGWHTLKFCRQLPKLLTWNKPVEELESPWYLVQIC